MNMNAMWGKCEVCGEETYLQRTYFHYNIECLCHSPKHFVCVKHCKNCKPEPPIEIRPFLKGDKYLIEEE